MKIINDDLLKATNASQLCELCYKIGEMHPHHIYFRKQGGCRLDVPINLIWVCVDCHREAHGKDAAEFKQRFLACKADDAGCEAEDVAAVIEAVLRIPKSPPTWRQTLKEYEQVFQDEPTRAQERLTLYRRIMAKHGPEEWRE